MSRKSFSFLVLVFAMFLAACGGGGGGSGGGPGGSSSLAITISGLPAGTVAVVSITGPDGSLRTVSATQTLTNLAAGTYEITSSSVFNGSTVFVPDPIRTSIALVAGEAQTVAISYAEGTPVTLGLQTVVTGLSNPVHLTAPPGDATRLYIVERVGRIRVAQGGILLPSPFLDLSDIISTDGERGLLSMAFHPQYASNGFFYVFYSRSDGDIVVERYTASDPNTVNRNTAQEILTIPHSANNNHYGGLLEFGPNGMLFISTGDGGGAGDPDGNAQSLNSLLGKMLRIDVTNSGASAYAIPPSNPFVGQVGIRPEIWAYGLRNPWRYAFDAIAGLLYLPDVGQATREEINAAPAGQGGLNYGWNILEGSLCFAGEPCDRTGKTPPVLEYASNVPGGACAVIGGQVYSGAIPELQGRFFYSDLCAGWLRSATVQNGQVVESTQWNVPSLAGINSFGQDASGELYMMFGSGPRNGSVVRLVRQP